MSDRTDERFTYGLRASELLVVAVQHVSEVEPTIYLGRPSRRDQHLSLTLESAQRLIAALGSQLAELRRSA